MPRRYLAEALYPVISNFLTEPRAYDLRAADAVALRQVLESEVYPAMQKGPDISRERDAHLRSWLVSLGAPGVSVAA